VSADVSADLSADLSAVGLAVGHATDEAGATGCTVVRALEGAWRGGAVVFGRATGTRELESLSPSHLADRVDAVLLTGGSAYGLDAAAGVMKWMEERGRGFAVPGGVVPIVPAAVIFDLAPLGRFDARPTAAMAYDACAHATTSGIQEGSVGAGTGATVGKIAGPAHAMKGGFGCAVARGGDASVAAVVVVNALGDVRDATGRIIAGARDEGGGFVDTSRRIAEGLQSGAGNSADPGGGEARMHNTTLAVVATDAALSRDETTQLARAAGAALFRRITPAGTSVDGDIVFALARHEGRRSPLPQLESLATRALEEAIERAVRLARGRDGVPGLGDRA
jgi:L-aminopeptidase/D-esterase-like protein